MNKDQLISKFSIEIESLKGHLNRWKKSNYQIQPIDLEVSRMKILELYELWNQLQMLPLKDGETYENSIHKTIPEPPAVKPAAREVFDASPEPSMINDVLKSIDKTDVREDELLKGGEKETVQNLDDAPKSVQGETPPAPKADETKTAPTLGERLNRGRITDLRSAIDIHDKFLMIRELFNNDAQRYARIIQELNDFKSLKGAQTFLQELRVEHQWKDDSQAFEVLASLVERKYSFR